MVTMFPAWAHLLAVTSLVLFGACLVAVHADCGPVAVETDSRLAEQTQQQHLHALFLKYGQNGSISLAGLQRLLEGVGLDRIRKVVVQHHGNEHNHTHSHSHSHPHAHKHTTQTLSVSSKKESDGSHVEKSDSTPNMHPDSVSGKKSQSDAHHNLYMKRAPDSTALLTTPSYATKSRRANRSANYNLVQDADSPQSNTTHSNQTENLSAHHLDIHEHDDHEHDHGQTSLNYSQECQNATAILQSHGMSQEVILSVRDFSFLCPALLAQIDSKSCLLHPENQSDYKNHRHHDDDHHHHHHHHHHHDLPNDKTHKSSPIQIAWIGGFLAITIISLLALVGVVLIPLMNRVCFNFLLSFLVALAVGTLSGDAFLHLIPHSQGHHKHHLEANESLEHSLHGDDEDSLKPVWTGLTALGGVYVMFLIEHFLTLAKMYKDKKQKVQRRADLANEILESEKLPALEDHDVKSLDDAGANGRHARGLGLPEEEEVMLSQSCYTDEDCENKCHSHFHDTVGQSDEQHHHHHDYHHILHHHHSQNHHPHTHTHRHTQSYSVQHFEHAGVATLAWMVIMGDGLHNFSDGLAIGAAFTEGLSSGLSTSVAVFCHELPHELGDFAVLLKAGMTVKQAILYNLLSALMGYLGMITGILIGHYAENVAMWIFALTAGLFMYVALVDMVPEMLHNNASEAGFSHYGFFVLQNAGILLGFGIMLVIAVFEHKIQLSIDF
ncbi:zinc transporter ZIP6 isoform X2 [Colossoma macropomum]|uniref:zinc transporter ZIP6 isoform X2 n=1 Tax=Colossoma macropomum TaxID=42526 RepID=UPI0018651145|nr:zinc transporter ZIP6 isoform X2 [Colossoma macropomum]